MGLVVCSVDERLFIVSSSTNSMVLAVYTVDVLVLMVM
jgi:hypothetical protein